MARWWKGTQDAPSGVAGTRTEEMAEAEAPLRPRGAEEEAKVAKQKALDACREQHAKLMKCLTRDASWSSFNGAWFCAAENKEFWACFEKERGGIKFKPSVFWDNMMRVPLGLQRQSEDAAAVNAAASAGHPPSGPGPDGGKK